MRFVARTVSHGKVVKSDPYTSHLELPALHRSQSRGQPKGEFIQITRQLRDLATLEE